ncbi:MAG: molybdopterin cofactor-binding domain-containing protein [Bacillota bacterium]|nr:molybdopterin cofactor-binding domain-containing protein [Bacillota bacterium]
MDNHFDVIGSVLPKKDGIAKVTGKEIYASDVELPDMMHAVVLRSTVAHAEIKSIDTSEAEAMGAICLVPDDVPQVYYNERIVSIPEKTYRDRLVLPRKVRHYGEAIAAVAAETEEEAFAAMQKIKVEYKELPFYTDPLEANKPGAAPIYESVFLGENKFDVVNNVACERNITVGIFNCCPTCGTRFDYSCRMDEYHCGCGVVYTPAEDDGKAFDNAEVILEKEYDLSRVYHAQMETKSAVCRPEPEGGFTLWTTTQSIHNVRILLGEIFSIPLNKINVKRVALGGGFGSSIQMNSITPICAALALKARRPVKLVSSREEDMYDHHKYPAKFKFKIGATKDGKIVAGHLTVIVGIGGHNVQAYPLLGCMAGWYASLYKFPNLKFEGTAVYTNQAPCCAMQGYGNPQVNFAVESTIDMLAEELGMDPIELRLKNYVGLGDEFWGQGPTVKSTIKSCGVEEMLERGSKMIDWYERPQPGSGDGNVLRGVGLARGFHTSGTGGPKPGEVIDYSSASVKINEDGSIDIMTPIMDHGGGTWDAAVKIVSELLKVPYEMVSLSPTDTRTTGYDVNTHATRGVYCGCGAAYHVALKVKQELLTVAGQFLEEHPHDLDLIMDKESGQGVIVTKGLDCKRMTVGEVAAKARVLSMGTIAATGSYRQKNCPPCFVTNFVEVEVDKRTGQIRVVKSVTLGDCGTTINPDMLEGQLVGGLNRGIGYSTLEEASYDPKTGKLNCEGFYDSYKMTTAVEMPPLNKIETGFASTYEPTGPFGAKGLGEAAVNSIASAIANAVYNATGVRFTKLPITPAEVVAALKAKDEGRI